MKSSLNFVKYIYSYRNHLPALPMSLKHHNHSTCSRASSYKAMRVTSGPILINQITRGLANAQIEEREGALQATHSQYLIDDSDYNSMIYEWRKKENAPISKVFELNRVQTHSLGQKRQTHCTITFETFERNLKDSECLKKKQAILALKAIIEAHQAIFKKLGATSISLDKVGINKDGQVRVWINREVSRNEISGQILTKEETVVERIIELIDVLSGNSLNDLKEYILSTLNKKKKSQWSFVVLKNMVTSYVQCLHIKLPAFIKPKPRLLAKSNCHREQKPSSPESHTLGSYTRNNTTNSRDSFSAFFKTDQSLRLSRRRNTEKQSLNTSHMRAAIDSLQVSRRKSFFENKSPSPFATSVNKFSRDKQRKPSITINGNVIESISTQNSMIFNSKNSYPGKQADVEESPVFQLSLNEGIKTSSVFHECDYINEKYTPRCAPSINDLLLEKIGITSLPEVQVDEEASSSANSSHRKDYLQIEQSCTPAFNPKISINVSKKQSGISTTNNSHSNHFVGLGKKCRESNITILTEEDQCDKIRSSSQNQKKLDYRIGGTDKKSNAVWNSQKNRQITGSHCENMLTIHNILKETANNKTEENERPSRSKRTSIFKKVSEQERENGFKPFDLIKITTQNTMEKDQKDSTTTPFWSQRPIHFLTDLITETEMESFENTDYMSDGSPSKGSLTKRSSVEQKLVEVLKMNKKLVISTYLETESEKKIRSPGSPTRTQQQRLKEFSEGLSEFMTAQINSERVLTNNCWTKKLETLLQIDEMKESINCGPEIYQQKNMRKLDKLGLHGRDIGESIIPDQAYRNTLQ